MSGLDRPRGGPPPPPKLPPPEHGIRARRFGSTWWGQRWIGALERFSTAFALRLGRGRDYARQGRVHDLTVERGTIQARVTGTRAEPYEVVIRVAPLGAGAWERAIRAMAEKAIVAARLLAGEMPRQIDEVFRAGGESLFPTRAEELDTACSCPDWANPCKHVAAVHYVLGEFFDRDPFLLFELRGRPKADVLLALRQLRAAADRAAPGEGEARHRPGTVTLTGTPREQYEVFRARPDDFRFRIEAPEVEGAVLRHLGTPVSWRLPVPPHELLQPTVTRAAALARELALGAPAAKGDDPDGEPRRPSRR